MLVGGVASCVDPALGLVGAGPAAAARVVAGGDAAGAGPAADGGVAVVTSGLTSTPLSAMYRSTCSSLQRASGETLTLPLRASQPTTGAMTRLWVSARRRPVAQASYSASVSASGLTLRSAQHRSGSGL